MTEGESLEELKENLRDLTYVSSSFRLRPYFLIFL